MKVMSRCEPETNKTFINVILTEREVEQLVSGNVVSVDDANLQVQIVGYGEEDEQNKDA